MIDSRYVLEHYKDKDFSITDIGQITLDALRVLKKLVKQGYILKTIDYNFPVRKSRYISAYREGVDYLDNAFAVYVHDSGYKLRDGEDYKL